MDREAVIPYRGISERRWRSGRDGIRSKKILNERFRCWREISLRYDVLRRLPVARRFYLEEFQNFKFRLYFSECGDPTRKSKIFRSFSLLRKSGPFPFFSPLFFHSALLSLEFGPSDLDCTDFCTGFGRISRIPPILGLEAFLIEVRVSWARSSVGFSCRRCCLRGFVFLELELDSVGGAGERRIFLGARQR